jgi:hypothetical protein
MRDHRQAWAAAAFFALASQPLSAQTGARARLLDAYKWRSIGPARGGRSIAVAGVKGHPLEAYFGAVAAGCGRRGRRHHLGAGDRRPARSSSVGAVAVSESDPNVVFIGMGEACIRGNIMPGDGVYKSADAGKTWSHAGFRASTRSRRSASTRANPGHVFVAAFGRYGLASDERGLYKSSDGGSSWKRVLFRDGRTGAVDVAIDQADPR